MLDDSWRTYEQYTAPLGVGFMVQPGHHYGPGVDGYEYSPWGTYHFADRDGVGVDRSRATGTGFAGQYPPPWAEVYESPDAARTNCCCSSTTCRTAHVLHSGVDGHPAHLRHPLRRGWRRSRRPAGCGPALAGLVDPACTRGSASASRSSCAAPREWRDQVNTYFFRKSGVPDEQGRHIY